MKKNIIFLALAVVLAFSAFGVTNASAQPLPVVSAVFAIKKCETKALPASVEFTPADAAAGIRGYLVTTTVPVTLSTYGVTRVASSKGTETFKSPVSNLQVKHKALTVVTEVKTEVVVKKTATGAATAKVCSFTGDLGNKKYDLMSYPGDLVTVATVGQNGNVTRKATTVYLTQKPAATATPIASATRTATATKTNTPEPFQIMTCDHRLNVVMATGATGTIGDGDPSEFSTYAANGAFIASFEATGLFVISSQYNYQVLTNKVQNVWICDYKGSNGFESERANRVASQKARAMAGSGIFCDIYIDAQGHFTSQTKCINLNATATPTATVTSTKTRTPTNTSAASLVDTITATPTMTATPTASNTLEPSVTNTATDAPTEVTSTPTETPEAE